MSDFQNVISLTDILDIAATSILIYYILILIRGTRAVQIVLGVVVLLLLLGLANALHLLLLGTILQVIVVGAAVTLPIVFQPELRRALEQLGRGGLFRLPDREGRRVEDRWIGIVTRAALDLSSARCGALIVIEQFSGLKEYAESGTAIGAKLSVELLLAIFTPRSPLHDGAVIIRDGLVEAAGCFLPLSEQAAFTERRLGSRHRSALGLSEQTDAVVVVVSEESGAIAVAREGRLSGPLETELKLMRILVASTRRSPARNQARKSLFPWRSGFKPPPVEHVADISKKLPT